MFPLIFESLCAHKILLCSILPGLICIWNDMYEICTKTFMKGTFMEGTFMEGTFMEGTFMEGTFMEGTFMEGTFMCTPSFLVCTWSHGLCARARTHSLEGTLALSYFNLTEIIK